MALPREDNGPWEPEPGSEAEAFLRRVAAEGARTALRERRTRLFGLGVLAGVIGALLIMLPIALLLYHDARINARKFAHANCLISATSRPQENARAFVEREILQVATAAFDRLPARFRAAEDRQIARAARQEQARAPGQGLARVRRFSQLAGLVSDLPLVSCRATR